MIYKTASKTVHRTVLEDGYSYFSMHPGGNLLVSPAPLSRFLVDLFALIMRLLYHGDNPVFCVHFAGALVCRSAPSVVSRHLPHGEITLHPRFLLCQKEAKTCTLRGNFKIFIGFKL